MSRIEAFFQDNLLISVGMSTSKPRSSLTHCRNGSSRESRTTDKSRRSGDGLGGGSFNKGDHPWPVGGAIALPDRVALTVSHGASLTSWAGGDFQATANATVGQSKRESRDSCTVIADYLDAQTETGLGASRVGLCRDQRTEVVSGNPRSFPQRDKAEGQRAGGAKGQEGTGKMNPLQPI